MVNQTEKLNRCNSKAITFHVQVSRFFMKTKVSAVRPGFRLKPLIQFMKFTFQLESCVCFEELHATL